MGAVKQMTEDEVRDFAKIKMGFDIAEIGVQQGTGQITTFKQLGFTCKMNNHKPDGWYLPDNTNEVAIILETKSEMQDLSNQKWVDELLTNIEITNTKYKKCVGILFNGKEQRIFLNTEEYKKIPHELQSKKFYLDLFSNQKIDTQEIYLTTMKINNLLHFKFGVNDYYDRMIFTACALVAKRYGAWLDKGRDYTTLHNSILNTLSKSLDSAVKQNEKLRILLDMYSKIQMNITDNQQAIDDFIECVEKISELINSKYWNGEDVMGIFFNEFNRYKGKSENGQVFTPGHITSLMYRLVEANMNDNILDAACGSGAFLTMAMSNMINEAGGFTTTKAKKIMSEQLYGIEIDKRVFSLACANMLIHKDGKTNLEQMDSTSQEACDWIKEKKITKVLMNPPYERKCHPEIIIKNVLDNIEPHSIAAFLLPDKKLEKFSKTWRKDILKKHRLIKIIKLPEKTFDEGVTVSIFIFEAGIPQNSQEIFTCYIKDDGLERVKNQGRQDIKNKWHSIENAWVDIIKKQSGDDSIKWIKPSEFLSYQKDQVPFSVTEEDFVKTMTDYLLFKEEIDVKELTNSISNKIVYHSELSKDDSNIKVNIKRSDGNNEL